MFRKISLLFFLFFPALVNAAEGFVTKIKFDAQHSDNSRLVADVFVEDEVELTPSLEIDYTFNQNRFNANLNYRAEHTEFTQDTFENRTDLLGTGQATVTLVDRNVFWKVFQNNSRLRINSIEVGTRDNETRRSILQTGPSVVFNLDKESKLSFDAYFVESGFNNGVSNDSQQNQYSVSYSRQIDTQVQLGLTGRISKVEFDSSDQDYDNQRIGLTFDGQGKQLSYSIAIGQNKIDRKTGISFSGLYINSAFNINVGDTVLSLSADRELTDSSIGLGLSGNGQDGFFADTLSNLSGNVRNSDIVEQIRYELHLRQPVSGRSTLNLSMFYEDQDFQSLLSDFNFIGGKLALSYRSTRRLEFDYQYKWNRNELQTGVVGTLESSIKRGHRVQSTYSLSDSARILFWVEDNSRTYDQMTRDYDELAIGFRFEYRF